MSDQIAEYSKAMENFEKAKRRAEALVAVVRDAASKLQHWQNVRVSNVNVGFPLEIPHTNSINANNWPSAQQIAEALADYHSTLREAHNAYARIPVGERRVVQPPPNDSSR